MGRAIKRLVEDGREWEEKEQEATERSRSKRRGARTSFL